MPRAIFLATALLALCPAGPVLATEQAKELFLDNGTERLLFGRPLESRFHGGERKPEILRPRSTACRRGYQGTWEIRDGRLWLVALATCAAGEPIPLSRVFPGSRGPIPADWYTGTLLVPLGEIIGTTGRPGFRKAVYERYRQIEIEQGKVVRERMLGEEAGGAE